MKIESLVTFIITSIFVILGLSVSPFFFLGSVITAIIFLYLKKTGIVLNQDEMQEFIDLKSGYYSFYFVIIIATIFLMIRLLKEPGKVPPDLSIIILLPLIFKFAIQSFEHKNYKKAGFLISLITGIFWLLFSLLGEGFSTGFLIEGSIGAGIILFSIAGFKFPRVSGTFFLIFSLFILYFLIKSNMPDLVKIGVGVFLPLPLLVSGFFYLFSKREEYLNE